jgi:malonyl-CoA O-methyltransferase
MHREADRDRSVFLSVTGAYDRWADSYDGYDNPMGFGAGRVVDALAPDAGGKDVFEFGCGTGRNLAALKRAGAASLAGCDLSPGMLARAAARDKSFRLLQHDMTQALPWPDRSADLVLFALTLEHVAELRSPLGEARRILRPNGTIAVVEIHPWLSQDGLAAHFTEGGQEVRMPTVAHGFADYLNAFAATGLAVASCKEWRPRDFAPPVPAKVLKRGPDRPLVVEFSLRRPCAAAPGVP